RAHRVLDQRRSGRGETGGKPRPSGGNVTGPSAASPEFAAKRLELFKEAVPRLARVAVLIGGTDFDVRLAREIEVASPAAGVRIQRFKASVAEDFDSEIGRAHV